MVRFMDRAEYQAGSGQTPVELTAADADIIWRYDLIDELGVCPHDTASCSALIHGDLLYLSTSNGVDESHAKVVAPEAPAFVALDKRTGRLAAVEREGISSRLYHAQWCSPSAGKVGDDTLVFVGGGDGICYAFRALEEVPEQPVPLELVWSYDGNPPEYRYRDGKPDSVLRRRPPQAQRPQQERRHVRRPQPDHRHARVLQEPCLRGDRAGPGSRPRQGHAALH